MVFSLRYLHGPSHFHFISHRLYRTPYSVHRRCLIDNANCRAPPFYRYPPKRRPAPTLVVQTNVKKAIKMEEAEELKQRLEAAGAIVEIV